MHFEGTIVITDPCYIIKKNNYPSPKPADFNLPESIDRKPYKEYKTPNELAYKAACDKYFAEYRKKDDWSRCNCGQNMEVLGIHNYISESTIYGDWGCTVYQIDEEPKNFVDNLMRCIQENLEDEEYGEDESYIPYEGEYAGNFCADAGLVGVFLLDEILNYNPEWDSWVDKHSWCATIIEDFKGEAEYYIDKIDKAAHIVGTGNINFYTIQTGI